MLLIWTYLILSQDFQYMHVLRGGREREGRSTQRLSDPTLVYRKERKISILPAMVSALCME